MTLFNTFLEINHITTIIILRSPNVMDGRDFNGRSPIPTVISLYLTNNLKIMVFENSFLCSMLIICVPLAVKIVLNHSEPLLTHKITLLVFNQRNNLQSIVINLTMFHPLTRYTMQFRWVIII